MTKKDKIYILIGLIFLIGIIVIFVYPIFPRMTDRGTMSRCMSNLHDIGMALKLYHQDYNSYPETLAGTAQIIDGKVVPLEKSKGNGLFPSYIRSITAFHCRFSPYDRTDEVVTVKTIDKTLKYYKYDSYDLFIAEQDRDKDRLYGDSLRYIPSWASSPMEVGHLAPFPWGMSDSNELQKEDFKRQFSSDDPPGDTVVTWCSNHLENNSDDRIPVLFLDGHCDIYPPKIVEDCKWRIKPQP